MLGDAALWGDGGLGRRGGHPGVQRMRAMDYFTKSYLFIFEKD
jgi:hypothetical protein